MTATLDESLETATGMAGRRHLYRILAGFRAAGSETGADAKEKPAS